MANLLTINQQFFDNSGNPLSGGLLYSYEVTSTTPKALYTTSAATVELSNPVVLDGYGRVSTGIYGSGQYRLILKNSAGTTIWDVDNIALYNTSTTSSSGSTYLDPDINIIENNDFTKFQTTASTSRANQVECADKWYHISQTGANNVSQTSGATLDTLGTVALRITQAQAAAQRMGLLQTVKNHKVVPLRSAVIQEFVRVRCSIATTIKAAIIFRNGVLDSSSAMSTALVNNWASSSYTIGGFFINDANYTVGAVASQAVLADTFTSITLSATAASNATNAALIVWTESALSQNATLDVISAAMYPSDTALSFRPTIDEQTTLRAITTADLGNLQVTSNTITATNTNGSVTLAADGTGEIVASSNLRVAAGKTIILEGTTDDAFETIITCTDPTADRTVTLPNADMSNWLLQIARTSTGAVATGTTTTPLDDTIPQNTEGDQYMSLAITPKSATSILEITISLGAIGSSASGGATTIALHQDTTANALASWVLQDSAQANSAAGGTYTFYMTSGTTSATTFKVRLGKSAAATTTFNGLASARLYGGVCASSIVIKEYVS